nr:hypothetical protein [Desulfosarcina cetonica]
MRPGLAGRAGNTFFIQARCNGFGGFVLISVFLKDAPDDLSLIFVNFPLSPYGFTGCIEFSGDLISIGQTAAGFAFFHPTPKAAPGFIGQVLQEHGIHGPFKADMQR